MEKKERRVYTKEFEREAVNRVTEQGNAEGEAAKNLGVHQRLLRRWKKRPDKEGAHAFPGKEHMTPEQEELHRLRKETKQLRMERERLKKATAFFVKESKEDSALFGNRRRPFQ